MLYELSLQTFWSGRHAHNIPHDQKSSGIFVGGAWNNYEGLPANFSERLDQTLTTEARSLYGDEDCLDFILTFRV